MTNSREIAAHILTDIYLNFQFLENLISKNRDFYRLDYRDKAFVRLIILNTLRRNGQIQAIIDEFIKKPLKKKDAFILNLIRISICQILFLNVKEYSVVNTAVQISKNHNRDKFVNGVLRNICRNKTAILNKTTVESNIPDWIKKNILKSFGHKQFIKIAKNISKEPLVDIKIKKNHCVTKNWEKILNGKFISSEIIRLKNDGPIDKKPFFDKGFWWVQSLSATLPVNIISSIFKESQNSGISVLDIGAAPGGKTCQLLEEGFDVTSLEISQRRTKRLKENLKRVNYKTKILNKDLLHFKTNKLFDCILIDAPCTASGLIQKKPEILIMNKSVNLDKLALKQKSILEKSMSLVKKGGYILYCVCSIHSREGIDLIQNFLKNNSNFEINFIDDQISKLGRVIKGTLFVMPDNEKFENGMDGFFIALLKKK